MIRFSWLTEHELRDMIRGAEEELRVRRTRRPRSRAPLAVIPNDLQRAKAKRLLGGRGTR